MKQQTEAGGSVVKGRNLDRAGKESGSLVIAMGYCVCVFAFVNSMGASNWQSASHLDFDFSRLAHWRSTAVWGRQRLSSPRQLNPSSPSQHPPACLRLFTRGQASHTLFTFAHQAVPSGVESKERLRRGRVKAGKNTSLCPPVSVK